jgi:SnoaL-like domain
MDTNGDGRFATLAGAWVDAFNRRDADALVALNDSEVDWHPSVLVGSRRTYRGHDGMRRWVEDLIGAAVQHRLVLRSVHSIDERRFAAVVDVYIDDKLVTPGALVVRLGEHFTIVEGHSYLTNVGLPRQYGISET